MTQADTLNLEAYSSKTETERLLSRCTPTAFSKLAFCLLQVAVFQLDQGLLCSVLYPSGPIPGCIYRNNIARNHLSPSGFRRIPLYLPPPVTRRKTHESSPVTMPRQI